MSSEVVGSVGAWIDGTFIPNNVNLNPPCEVTYQGQRSEQSRFDLFDDNFSAEPEVRFEAQSGTSQESNIIVPELCGTILNDGVDGAESESGIHDTQTKTAKWTARKKQRAVQQIFQKARVHRLRQRVKKLQVEAIMSEYKLRKTEDQIDFIEVEKRTWEMMYDAVVQKSQQENMQLRCMYGGSMEENLNAVDPFLISPVKINESYIHRYHNQPPLKQTLGVTAIGSVDLQDMGFESADAEKGYSLQIEEHLLEPWSSPAVVTLPVSGAKGELPIALTEQDVSVSVASDPAGHQHKSVMESDKQSNPRGKIKKRDVRKQYVQWKNKNIKFLSAMIEEMDETGGDGDTEPIFLKRVWKRSGCIFPADKIRDNINNILRRNLKESKYKSVGDIKEDRDEYKRLLDVIRTQLGGTNKETSKAVP